MSYEYKGRLLTLADMYLNAGDHEPLLEIEHVYEQAAKADEYEAKAKAFDELRLKIKSKDEAILTNKNATDEDLAFVANNTAVLWEMSDLELKFRKDNESEESE